MAGDLFSIFLAFSLTGTVARRSELPADKRTIKVLRLKYFLTNSLTFSQHGVDSGTHHLAVDSLDGLLIGVLGVGGVVGDVVTLGLQLSDALQQLGDGGRDVGQLDDVSLGGLGELAQCCQLIRNPLFRSQSLGEVSNQAPGNRDVSLLNLTKRTCTLTEMHFAPERDDLPRCPWAWQTSG